MVCTTEHQRVEARESRKYTVVWAEYSRSQNSGQCRTIQKLARTVGLDLGEREMWPFLYVIASKRDRRQKLTRAGTVGNDQKSRNEI